MNPPRKWQPILLRVVGLWLLGAIACGAFGLYFFSVRLFYGLKSYGVETTGIVTQLQPANHQAVYYSFEVPGSTYSHIGRAGFGHPEFRSLTVGQNVVVYYLPDDPSRSCLGNPELLFDNEVIPVILMASLIV